MAKYVVKRLLGTIPLMFFISILIFSFVHLIPGDPAMKMVDKDATQEEIQMVREELGLNDPIPVQYFNYMKGLFTGDLGTSYRTGDSVTSMISGRMGATLSLGFFALIWAVIIGILIGIISAVKRGKTLDNIGMFIGISGISIPGFWLGLVLIQIFSVNLGLVPTGGLDSWKGYILPSLTLGMGIMGTLARYSRSSMVETLGENYVRTARAKGQKESLVIGRHAFRNSLVEIVTIIGLQIGGLLGGAVLTETVFSIPGLGRLLVESINYRDYEVVQALLMFFALEYIIINLIVDVLYGVLNPKIRYD